MAFCVCFVFEGLLVVLAVIYFSVTARSADYHGFDQDIAFSTFLLSFFASFFFQTSRQ